MYNVGKKCLQCNHKYYDFYSHSTSVFMIICLKWVKGKIVLARNYCLRVLAR